MNISYSRGYLKTSVITIIFVANIVFPSCTLQEAPHDRPPATEQRALDKASVVVPLPAPDTPAIITPKANVGNFKHSDLARFTIASIMGKEPKIIGSKKEKEYYKVTYRRPSDNQVFEYKVKFDGNKITWGNIDGRWRNDELISFEESGNAVTIIQGFSDGSVDRQTYKKGQ